MQSKDRIYNSILLTLSVPKN